MCIAKIQGLLAVAEFIRYIKLVRVQKMESKPSKLIWQYSTPIMKQQGSLLIYSTENDMCMFIRNGYVDQKK